MANHKNVTVSLSPELLHEARHMAVDQGVSLSRFLAMLLEERVASARHYQQARERQRSMMDRGFDLGTYGTSTWTRDDLHGR